MPARVGHYMFSLFSRQLRELEGDLLPAAYCMVFYHGDPYPYSMHLADCFNDPLGLMQNLFGEPIPLIDVNELPEEQLRQQQQIGMLAQLMKHIRDADISPILIELLSCFEGVSATDQVKLDFLRSLLEYALAAGQTNDAHLDSVLEQVNESATHFGDKNTATIAELLRQRGLKEGIERGRQEGLVAGKLETAKAMMEKGFDTAQIAKITGLTIDQVESLKHWFAAIHVARQVVQPTVSVMFVAGRRFYKPKAWETMCGKD